MPGLRQAIEDLSSPDRGIRDRGISALREMGARAAGVVPNLVQLATDHPEHRNSIVSALGKIGDASMEALSVILPGLDGTDDDRTVACHAIGDIGPPAREAIPKLIENLDYWEGRHRAVRYAAVQALGRMGPLAVHAMPALLESFAKEPGDMRMRSKIIPDAIRAIGPAAIPAIREGLLRHRKSHVPHWVIPILKEWGRDAASALPELCAFISSPGRQDVNHILAMDAIAAMGESGATAAEAVRKVMLGPVDDPRCFHVQAAATLIRIGSGDEAAVWIVRETMASEEVRGKEFAIRVLPELDGREAEITLLKYRDTPGIKWAVEETLKRMGWL